MASAKGKVVVSAEVPVELRDAADARAVQEGRSRADIIGRAIRFYLVNAAVVRTDDVPPALPVASDTPKKSPRK